jgi:hypothetical protein
MSDRTDTERLDWLERVSTPPDMMVPNVFSSRWLCGWEEDTSLRVVIDAAMGAEENPSDE